MMKRERELGDDHGITNTMANYLMLLSRGSEILINNNNNNNFNSRVFECKTCNRQFPSFQALGGHRASHKKLRLMGESNSNSTSSSDDDQKMMIHASPIITKAKTHECSICGMEFAIGQALGGHMRRHRSRTRGTAYMHNFINSIPTTTSSGSGCTSVDYNNSSNTNRLMVNLFPDLNLTPIENDLEILKIGQSIPLVDCFN